MTDDPYRLRRFTDAQDAGDTYAHALAELLAGRKQGHWMWFVFPQVAGLGRSPTARTYAIASLDEARAYLRHPVLGPRLMEATQAVDQLPAGRTPDQVFGSLDAVKLRSSMTLFARAAPEEPLFGRVLGRHFDGVADAATVQRL
jgi:uncharacterized protein (DUF1810 family)